jgi:hypothetical protein
MAVTKECEVEWKRKNKEKCVKWGNIPDTIESMAGPSKDKGKAKEEKAMDEGKSERG